jgi:DNA-nicking Smr family endonuclease
MKRSANTPQEGKRVVTADEAELWYYTTKSLDPVKAKPRVDAGSKRFGPASEASPAPLRRVVPASQTASRTQAGKPRASPPLVDFDRRKARQIAAGKAEVDARIDLHGLDQRAAYLRLRSFLTDAHARGDRLVLVITGKGGGEEALDRLGELAGGRRRGVLRRNLPNWLEEPEFRVMVSSFTQAGARHGGAGALYVQLRRGR